MVQLTFSHLVENKVLDVRECQLLSYAITHEGDLTLSTLSAVFPRMRMSTIEALCERLVAKLYFDKTEVDDAIEGKIGLYGINRPIVKELLIRNDESLDGDLGRQINVIEKILGAAEEKPAAPAPSTSEPRNGPFAPTKPTNIADDIKAAPAVSAPTPLRAQAPQNSGQAAFPIQTSAAVPANPEPRTESQKTKKAKRKGGDTAAALIAMSEDDMYNTVRAAAADIIAASAERYPQVIGLNPDVCAEAFINHYSSKGWMVGKNKMVDWRAALRNAIREPWTSMARNKQYTQSDLALRMAAEGAKMDAIFGPAKLVTPPQPAPKREINIGDIDLSDDNWLLKYSGFNPDGTPIDKSASSSPASSPPALIEGNAQTISEEERARKRDLAIMEEMAAKELARQQAIYDAGEEEEEADEEEYY